LNRQVTAQFNTLMNRNLSPAFSLAFIARVKGGVTPWVTPIIKTRLRIRVHARIRVRALVADGTCSTIENRYGCDIDTRAGPKRPWKSCRILAAPRVCAHEDARQRGGRFELHTQARPASTAQCPKAKRAKSP
jgi:hypothetical protein